MPQYIIYCDESTDKGKFYSDFYGGALLDSRFRQSIEQVLMDAKGKCQGEMKWTKISEYNEIDYKKFIDAIMDLVRDGYLKVRIMFRQNINQPPPGMSEEEKFFKLYYQFVKHAFGLRYCNQARIMKINIILFLDKVPDTQDKFNNFKDYMSRLSEFNFFKNAKVSVNKQDITDVVSGQHIILQAVDVILGAMQFRLNEMHKEIPPGKRCRGKRTKAKERVYNHLNSRIRAIYAGFNIGISTGMLEGQQVTWTHPYRHWSFDPKGGIKDFSKGKKRIKKNAAPQEPT